MILMALVKYCGFFFLQTIETTDNGKPFTNSLMIDISGVCKALRYFAGAADKLTGQTIPIGKVSSHVLKMFTYPSVNVVLYPLYYCITG